DAAISDRDTTKPSLWQNEAAQQKTIALWQKLAERYKNENWIGGYDLINETNWGFEKASDKNGCEEKINAPLKALLQAITKVIRQVDTNHIIFIEANCWANNYAGIFPLWDSNMVVSFHKYWNNNDVASIEKFLQIREQKNVPVWMGESGENSNVWFRTAIQLLEENKIGWAWWPLKKLGNNNPLQIKKNKEYEMLISYMESKSPKLSVEQAFAALMQLAEDAKIENNIFHKDVVDAMFRQTTSTVTLPFKKNAIENIIYAVDYDLGRIGYAYYDIDSATYWVSTGKGTEWNKGRQYRNDGVDIDICRDSINNGYAVTSMEKGEWLQYTITAKKEGKYKLSIGAVAIGSTNEIGISINDGPTNKLLVKPTKNGSWKTFILKGIQLKEGKNLLKVEVIKGVFSLNYFQFVPQNK
ncbi:MAG: cellulase family glycosylhydrolase, partial [Bacteroidota bacterium]|nr:cellulase family glycosylhydrolase [Bacteroidota bacterium]